jgi:hypothetical protein
MICVSITAFFYYLYQYDFKLTPEQYALLEIISQDSNVPESMRDEIDEIKDGDVSQNEYRYFIKRSYEYSAAVKNSYDEEKLEYIKKVVPMLLAMIVSSLAALFIVAATGGITHIYLIVPFVVIPIVMGVLNALLLDNIILMLM